MTVPRAQHYLPVFYLRGFADPIILVREGKEVLWVYEKQRSIRKSTPKNEAHQRDFYLYEEGSIEKELGQMESIIQPILKRVREKGNFFTDREKGEVAQFVGLMFFRVPSGRNFIDRLAGETMKIISQERARDEVGFKEDYIKVAKAENTLYSYEKARELRELILSGDFEVEQKSAGYNLKLMLEAAADTGITLANLNWQILWAPESQMFLTADNPVISILPGDDRRATMGVGFAQPGVEVYFTLSAQACLRMGQDLGEGVFDAKGKYVRQVNRTLMFCAERFTYAPERNAKLKKLFDKIGCQLVYGETAFIPPWKGLPERSPAK